jgi:hypothetical protein
MDNNQDQTDPQSIIDPVSTILLEGSFSIDEDDEYITLENDIFKVVMSILDISWSSGKKEGHVSRPVSHMLMGFSYSLYEDGKDISFCTDLVEVKLLITEITWCNSSLAVCVG